MKLKGFDSVLDNTDSLQSDLIRFVSFAILGVAASYLNVNIPYTKIYIEGRWIFGFMGFVVLNRWWMALLLTCVLSLAGSGNLPIWTIFIGNMTYALPALMLIRTLHYRVLNHLHSVLEYGAAWLLMILLGYQLFSPVVWGFTAILDNQPIWPVMFKAWKEQPLLVESLLVGIISALTMMVTRGNVTLRASKREINQILDTVPEGVLLLDTEGRVLQANPTAQKDLQVLAKANVGDCLTYLGNQPLSKLLTPPPTQGLWHEIKMGDQTFEAIAQPVEGEPETEHWVLVINDVTHEREIQDQLQQQERLAAVGQLAAGIAHDFNNIMATIILYLRMIERAEGLSERDRERVEVVNQQAWHASRLIDQILDFSRRAALERQPLDLLLLLKEQVKLLKRTLPEHINITLIYDPDVYFVNADATRIQQILTNLAVNARDAMPKGGTLRIELIRVTNKTKNNPRLSTVSLQQAEEPEIDGWIRLTISDTGTGIMPNALPHIFEPFFTTKDPGKGSGLGLAQVYGIVKHHQGHIDVTTNVGEGTTFTIHLPALNTQQSDGATRNTQILATHGQGETILVVEDDTALREALVDTLALLNYHVLEAAHGSQALEILESIASTEEPQEKVALVLSDLIMPQMGGEALLHAMRQRGLNVPLIILSGHPLEHELDSLRAEGLAGWLLKPPEIEQLAQLLARAIKKKEEILS